MATEAEIRKLLYGDDDTRKLLSDVEAKKQYDLVPATGYNYRVGDVEEKERRETKEHMEIGRRILYAPIEKHYKEAYRLKRLGELKKLDQVKLELSEYVKKAFGATEENPLYIEIMRNVPNPPSGSISPVEARMLKSEGQKTLEKYSLLGAGVLTSVLFPPAAPVILGGFVAHGAAEAAIVAPEGEKLSAALKSPFMGAVESVKMAEKSLAGSPLEKYEVREEFLESPLGTSLDVAMGIGLPFALGKMAVKGAISPFEKALKIRAEAKIDKIIEREKIAKEQVEYVQKRIEPKVEYAEPKTPILEKVDDVATEIQKFKEKTSGEKLAEVVANKIETARLPEIDVKVGYGERNSLVSKQSYELAVKSIMSKATSLKTGVDPSMIPNLLKVGLYHIEAGTRSFAKWSKRMVNELGKEFKPVLRKTWRELKPQRDQLAEVEKISKIYKKIAKPIISGEKIVMTPAELLKFSLQKQQEVSVGAFKAGKEAALAPKAMDMKRLIKQYITEKYKGESKTISASELNIFIKEAEVKGARFGYKAGEEVGKEAGFDYGMKRGVYLGKLEQKATTQQMMEYARQTLPENEYKLVARSVERAGRVRTTGDKAKFVNSINNLAGRYYKMSAIRDFKTISKEVNEAKIPNKHKELAKTLIDSVAARRHKPETIAKMAKIFDDYATGKLLDPNLAKRAKAVIETSGRKSIYKMEVEEIQNLNTAIKYFVNEGKKEVYLLGKKKAELAEKNTDDAIKAVIDIHGNKKPYLSTLEKRMEVKGAGWLKHTAYYDQLNLESVVQLLGKEKTVLTDTLYKIQRESQNKWYGITQDIADTTSKFMKRESITIRDLKDMSRTINDKAALVKIKLPSNRTIEITKGERIELIRHLADESTRWEILKPDSEGIIIFNLKTHAAKSFKLTVDDVKTIMESATPKEHAIVKMMSEVINGKLYDMLNETWKAENGFELPKHENYTPRRRYYKGDEDPANIINYARTFAEWKADMLDNMGILKERKFDNSPIIVQDAFSTFYSHTNRVAAYISKAEGLHNAKRLLNDKRFLDTVYANVKNGRTIIDRVEGFLSDFEGVKNIDKTAVNEFFRMQIRRAHVGALGLKPHIVLYQTVSIATAAAELGLKGLLSRRKLSIIREEMAKAPYFKNRMEGGSHQIFTPGTDSPAMHQFWGMKESVISEYTMKPIHVMDMEVIYRIWDASRKEGMKKGLSGEQLMKYTAERAEEVVTRTQSTWDPLSISTLARYGKEHAAYKLLVMFSSQTNKNYNMVVQNIVRGHRGDISKTKMLKGVLNPTIINAALIYGIGEGYYQLIGSTRDITVGNVISGIADRTISNWLIYGRLASFISDCAKANNIYQLNRAMGKSGNILGNITASFGSAIYYATRYVAEGKDNDLNNALDNSVRAFSILLGLPIQGAKEIIEAVIGREHKKAKTKSIIPSRFDSLIRKNNPLGQ